MKTYIKKITIVFALFSFVFQSFARTQYNENTLVDSDVSDSQIIVDSSSRGNVKVSVAENVSLTENSLSIYGENSSMEFLGNNEINIGNISVYKGALQSFPNLLNARRFLARRCLSLRHTAGEDSHFFNKGGL